MSIRLAASGPRKEYALDKLRNLYSRAEIKENITNYNNRELYYKKVEKIVNSMRKYPYGKREWKVNWNKSIIKIADLFKELSTSYREVS